MCNNGSEFSFPPYNIFLQKTLDLRTPVTFYAVTKSSFWEIISGVLAHLFTFRYLHIPPSRNLPLEFYETIYFLFSLKSMEINNLTIIYLITVNLLLYSTDLSTTMVQDVMGALIYTLYNINTSFIQYISVQLGVFPLSL